MKTLQVTIIAVLTISTILTTCVFAQNTGSVALVFLRPDKEIYFPGDSVFIHGQDNMNVTGITIGLEKNHKLMTISKESQVLQNGTFYANFTLPKDPDAQYWSLVSGPLVQDLNFKPVYLSPLKQFKSGVVANGGFITCKPGFYFVLKFYDKEPLCLKAGTISKLASRGFLFDTSISNDNHTTVIISPGSENPDSPNTYSPNIITIVLGVNNTVRWINQADVANEIVPDMPLIQNGKSFGSDGVIKPDQSYAFTFTEPGTFAYHTEPHPWMKGTVIVLSSPNTGSHTYGEENATLPASFAPCDTPFQASNDGIAILYMPLNSIGKLCVRYSNYNNSPEQFSGGINIFDPNNSYQSVPDITTWSNLGNTTIIQKNDSFTTVYWIKTGNHTGLYGLNLYCGGIPFAVGYGYSNLTAVNFPFVGKSFSCPVIAYDSKIDSMTGIGVKYIPYP